MIASASNPTCPALNPNSCARRNVVKRFADSMNVLLGMQPRRMQVPPPSSPPSTQTVLSPDSAATFAAEKPALPPPITTKSNVSIAATTYNRLRHFQRQSEKGFRRAAHSFDRAITKRNIERDKPQNLVYHHLLNHYKLGPLIACKSPPAAYY